MSLAIHSNLNRVQLLHSLLTFVILGLVLQPCNAHYNYYNKTNGKGRMSSMGHVKGYGKGRGGGGGVSSYGHVKQSKAHQKRTSVNGTSTISVVPTAPPSKATMTDKPTAPPVKETITEEPTLPPSKETITDKPITMTKEPTAPPSKKNMSDEPSAPPSKRTMPDKPTAPPSKVNMPNNPTTSPLKTTCVVSSTTEARFCLLLDVTIPLSDYTFGWNFVKNLVNAINTTSPKSTYSIVTFGSVAKILLSNSDATSAINAITSDFLGFGIPATDLGFSKCQETFGFGNGKSDVIIILTHGNTINSTKADDAANAAKDKNTTIVCLGVGSDIKDNTLKEWSSVPELTFITYGFTSLGNLDENFTKKIRCA